MDSRSRSCRFRGLLVDRHRAGQTVRLPTPTNCFPYLSASITEFWRRWHMSLSSWLRQYLYIPLGGSRKGELRAYVNLFLVFWRVVARRGVELCRLGHDARDLPGARSSSPPKCSTRPKVRAPYPFRCSARRAGGPRFPVGVSPVGVVPDAGLPSGGAVFQHLVTQPCTARRRRSSWSRCTACRSCWHLQAWGARQSLAGTVARGLATAPWLPYAALLFFIVTNSGATGAFITSSFSETMPEHPGWRRGTCCLHSVPRSTGWHAAYGEAVRSATRSSGSVTTAPGTPTWCSWALRWADACGRRAGRAGVAR
jgi:hypothetical protein